MRLRFVPGISVRFQTLSQFGGQLALALLALPPLSFSGIATQKRTVRLACLIHAASVRSEPESNSPNIEIFARADPLGGPGLCFGLNTILFFYKHELFAVGPASRLPVSSAPVSVSPTYAKEETAGCGLRRVAECAARMRLCFQRTGASHRCPVSGAPSSPPRCPRPQPGLAVCCACGKIYHFRPRKVNTVAKKNYTPDENITKAL